MTGTRSGTGIGCNDWLGTRCSSVVFLDIDGVLNSLETFWTLGSGKNWSPVSVGLVERLCKATDASIVVSSSWRCHQPTERLRQVFRKHRAPALAERIIGRTPQPDEMPASDEFLTPRGREIACWLDMAGADNWVILDDDSDMLPEQKSRFVHTTFGRGFGAPEYLQALRIMAPEHPDLRAALEVPWFRVPNA